MGLLLNWTKVSAGDEVLVFYSMEEPEVRIYHRLLALLAAELEKGWTSAKVRDYLRDPYSRDAWPRVDALERAKGTLRNWEGRLLVVRSPLVDGGGPGRPRPKPGLPP